jgi:hypothetical protein
LRARAGIEMRNAHEKRRVPYSNAVHAEKARRAGAI